MGRSSGPLATWKRVREVRRSDWCFYEVYEVHEFWIGDVYMNGKVRCFWDENCKGGVFLDSGFRIGVLRRCKELDFDLGWSEFLDDLC
jgi:hypothetical protein